MKQRREELPETPAALRAGVGRPWSAGMTPTREPAVWQGGYEITLRPPSVTPVVDRRELVAVFTCRV